MKKLLFASLLTMQNFWTPEILAEETIAWRQTRENKNEFTIRIENLLTDRQKKLISSGFSSYSELWISSIPGVSTYETLPKVICTVRFDTWEEKYDIARVTPTIQTKTTKSFQDYAELCLRLSIPESLLTPTSERSPITVIFQMTQMSPQKSEQIKDWLVRQQSGVMQGIFAHMIGDLSLSEKINIKINVPIIAGKASSKVQ